MFHWVLLISLLIATHPAWAATRYVNPGGSGSTCSSGSPCAAQTGMNQTGNGDTLIFQDGTYDNLPNLEGGPGLNIPTSASGSTIRAENGATVILQRRVRLDDNLDGVTISANAANGGRFIIDGDGDTSGVAFESSESFNMWFEDLELRWNAMGFVGGYHNSTFLRNHIHHFGVDTNGFVTRGCWNALGRGGQPWQAGTFDNHCHGFYTQGSSPNNLIDGNHIHHGAGWGVEENGSGATIRNNNIHDTNDWCIGLLEGHSDALVYNNICNRNVHGITSFFGSRNKIFNNTIVNQSDEAAGVQYGGNSNEFRNNIFYNNGNTINWDPDAAQPITSNNLCNSTGTFCQLGGDPRFVDAPGDDFHLRNDSPAINAGVNLEGIPSSDHEGNPRPEPGGTTKDIGAYECQNLEGLSCGGTAPQPEPGSIVASYDFEIGTGTSLPDITTNGHTGTWNECAGNACWGNGIIGAKAGVFNGSRYVEVTNTTGLKPTAAISMVARINLTGTGAGGCEVLSIGDSAAMRVQPDGNVTGFIYNGSSWPDAISTGRNVLDGASHLLGLSYDGSSVRVRLDAGEASFAPASGLISWTLGANLQISRHGNGGAGYACTGRIDQVRILDGFCTTECFDAFYGEFVPSLGLAATHSRFEVADAAEGTTFPGIGTDAPGIVVNRSSKLVQAWSLTRAGSTVSKYFPMHCAVPGFNGGAYTKLTNSCATIPVCIADHTLRNMGDSTGNFLPNDGLVNVAGRWVVDIINLTSRITMVDGNRAEWRYQYAFSPTVADGTVITCRPHDEDDSLLTSYVAPLPTIEINVPGLEGIQGLRIGGLAKGGKTQ